uniref:F-box domain-containing protein n=1 Tax=Oryza rufipogon TaxID=4529 RepID=A0A0E0PKZ8_ORYRU
MAAPELNSLMDDVVEEILLRLPPDDPSCAVRASLVCKRWRRLLTDDPCFQRRYRAFHRRRARAPPPLLGFIHHVSDDQHPGAPTVSRFVLTTAFRPAEPERRRGWWWPIDCRHGRALFHSAGEGLAVWDPMAGDVRWQQEPRIPASDCMYSTAAVACAAPGCDHDHDHGDCGGGPFVLVFVAVDERHETASAFSCSSETGEWSSAPSTVHLDRDVLAGGAVHFLTDYGRTVLRYDLAKLELSAIEPPEVHSDVLLTTTEGGDLGLAILDDQRYLRLWAWAADHGVTRRWVRRRVVDLFAELPFLQHVLPLNLTGFDEGTGMIFFQASDGDYAIDELMSSPRAKKLWGRDNFSNVFPYRSFYVHSNSLRRRLT